MRSAPAQSIVFVCYGNIIRSKAAEAFAKQEILRLSDDASIQISSAGVSLESESGNPPDPRIIQSCLALGVRPDGVSRRLAPILGSALIAVYVMSSELMPLAEELLGSTNAEMVLFGDLLPLNLKGDIPDPYHQPLLFDEVAHRIKIGVSNIFEMF